MRILVTIPNCRLTSKGREKRKEIYLVASVGATKMIHFTQLVFAFLAASCGPKMLSCRPMTGSKR